MEQEVLQINRVFLDQKLEKPLNFPKRENKLIYSHHKKGYNFEFLYDKPALSIKYVLTGKETYFLDKQAYTVNPGEFLLINQEREYSVFGEATDEITEGICVYICPKALQQVNHYIHRSEEKLIDEPQEDTKPMRAEFLEKVYRQDEDELGKLLQNVAYAVTRPGIHTLPDNYAFYANMAEKVLCSQKQITQRIDRLKTVKKSTREELFKRLEVARHYIDDYYSQKLCIPKIAREAALSEYHFYRSFKLVYGLSPYQYLLKRRLHKAYEFLGLRKLTVTEAAYLTGFSDIHAFSKAFKREFQVSPAQAKKD